MSLFQCEACGCRENNALACQGFKEFSGYFDWSYAPEREGMKLCSACGPALHAAGTPSKFGVWHGVFPRLFLPKGQFITNQRGNLEHAETGRTDIENFALPTPHQGTPAEGESRNPLYEGQFEGETVEQAEHRRHWAQAAFELRPDRSRWNVISAETDATVPSWLKPWLADYEAIEGCLEWAKAEEQTVNVGECECEDRDTILQSSAGWVTQLLTAMLEHSRPPEPR